jgi:methionyl-tRNA synthetase
MSDSSISPAGRPVFPKRAVVTGGMPYGNKRLHLGHIGAVFIPADIFTRFLRDRIGAQNVIFVSGTDCYGSPIVEYHRRAVAAGTFSGSLEDFVRQNHGLQKSELDSYRISNTLFGASALDRSGAVHQELSQEILATLHRNGWLKKISTPQFYDPAAGAYLNGRQVIGRCPIPGCKSEKAYADECDLGHPYEPRDLIAPKSVLTGEVPEMRDVTNWYIDLPSFRAQYSEWLAKLAEVPGFRPFITAAIQEFLEPPTIYVKQEFAEALEAERPKLPPHSLREDPSKAIPLVFKTLAEHDTAAAALKAAGIRFRSGKTLTPFRLTGNVAWSLPAPVLDGLAGLTFWVWPESLWAPISFTKTALEKAGASSEAWKDWWCSPDSSVYQFIGEDNIYFYSLAQMAIFMGLQGPKPVAAPPAGQLQPTVLVANKHLLQGKKKASSSGELPPIMAADLLKHYTPDQLRAHFFSLGLGLRSMSFNPKPFNPDALPQEADPVMKEAGLLSNVMNRLVRSCFYTAQKYFEGRLPAGTVDPAVLAECRQAALDYENFMHRQEFHSVMALLDTFIRSANKYWSASMKAVDQGDTEGVRPILVNAFYYLRVASLLIHPIAPDGSAKIQEYLGVPDSFWSWDHAFEPLPFFLKDPAAHVFKFLEPRVDFFEKHESQVGED